MKAHNSTIPHHHRKASLCKNLILPFGEHPPDVVYEMIISNAFRQTTEKIRSLMAQGRTAEANTLKRQQYGYTPSSVWSATRREENISAITGNIIVEADHLAEDELAKIALLVFQDAHAFMGFVTSSGAGYKWLCATNAATKEEHRETYRQLCSYYAEKLPEELAGKLDMKQPDPVRLMFLSCDQSNLSFFKTSYDVFRFTPSAIGQKVSAPKSPLPPVTVVDTSPDKLQIAAKMIREAVDGEKHNTLLRASVLAGGFVGAGLVSEEEAIRVLEYEISCKDILCMKTAEKTIRDGIRYGKSKPIYE